MSDTILSTINTSVNKTEKIPALNGLAWNLERDGQGINKHIQMPVIQNDMIENDVGGEKLRESFFGKLAFVQTPEQVRWRALQVKRKWQKKLWNVV